MTSASCAGVMPVHGAVATTAPVTSSVSVVTPSRMTPSYVFGQAAANGASRGARQPFERLRLLFFRPHDADAHLRVRQIGRDVDADHGDEADPRIAYIAGEKRSDRLPDQLTHALGPMTVSSHITDSSCWYRRCARRPRPPPAHPPRGARSLHAGGRCSPRPP